MSESGSPVVTPPVSPTKSENSGIYCDASEEVEIHHDEQPFNIHVVIDRFKRSLAHEDDVSLPLYVSAYRELNK